MIEYVQIDGQRAELANQKFPGYFSVDSMAVLIGENGSGKTRLLINVAEALTRGAEIGDQGHWRGWDGDGLPIGDDTKYPPSGQGVLYYTPLPYRRHITRHPHCFDASGSGLHQSRSRSYRQYQFVAHRLGVNARLVGRVSYRKDIFRRLLVPRMLEADCHLIDQAMESRRWELPRESKRTIDDSSYEAELDSFAKAIEMWILHVLESFGYEPIVALGCLEHSAKALSQRSRATQVFLQTIGIASFKLQEIEDGSSQTYVEIERFKRLISTTANFLDVSRVSGLRPIDSHEQVGYEVEIDYNGSPRRIGSRVGAFEIGWDNLSSGLLSLVEQFTRLELGLEKLRRRGLTSALVLIDEGDAYLHLDWQRQYIFHLDHFLGRIKRDLRFDSLQVLLATHSPIISGDFPSTMVHRLGPTRPNSAKTFGSSLDALVLETFGTPSIGVFAAQKISNLREKFVADKLQPVDRALINEIGDEGLRRAIVSSVEGCA